MTSDPIDQEKLRAARKWATNTLNRRVLTPPLEHCDAAAEVIRALPDVIVDGDKLREVIDKLRSEGHYVGENLAEELSVLLPAPAPRAEIALGNWAMHPVHGKVLITSTRADSDGWVKVCMEDDAYQVGACGRYVKGSDLSPVPSATPTEQDAPTPGTSPGGILHHPSSDHSADPEPQAEDVPGGEPWEVSVGNGQEYVGIRSETGIWELFDREDGHHSRWGLPGDITLITRMVPEQQPRVLTTIEDYENAPEGTVAAVTRTNYLITKEIGGSWLMNDGQPWEPRDARYEVIRWGWGEDRG